MRDSSYTLLKFSEWRKLLQRLLPVLVDLCKDAETEGAKESLKLLREAQSDALMADPGPVEGPQAEAKEEELRNRLEKLHDLVIRAADHADEELSKRIKDAAGLVRVKQSDIPPGLSISDGLLMGVRRAIEKSKKQGEPCVVAFAHGTDLPVIVAPRKRFEENPPFNMGPDHLIFDTERGFLGDKWRIECPDCGKESRPEDPNKHE